MRALSLDAPGKIHMVSLSEPPLPGPTEALIRIRQVGICGTDYHAFHGNQPFFTYPRILGHELGVEIVAVGTDVGHLATADFDPLWIEEPTSPDDILGHAAISRAVAPIRVATGEHVPNRIIFKQLFQAKAIGICQIDACRVGGVKEVLAILLMAARFGIPVCPHAGGVGLCEYVQHLSIFDYIAVSGSLENRMIEYTPHLHEHFVHPAIIKNGRYVAPDAPGYSITMYPASIAAYFYPEGSEWANERR